MGLKNNKISARGYFQELQLSGRNAELHPCTGTKRGFVSSFAERLLSSLSN